MTKFNFTDLEIGGFAMSSGYAGEQIKVLVRASLTSDEALFHLFLKGIDGVIRHHTQKQGVSINFNYVNQFLLVIHENNTADLYCNDIGMLAEMMPKRDVAKGEPIFKSDIADIRRFRFADITLQTSDKVVFCFKVGWKFGLFFDLSREHKFDVNRMELELGSLFRRLEYEEIYRALADDSLLQKLALAGWFPFQEIVSDGFETLLAGYRDEFDIEGREQAVLSSFDDMRISKIEAHWWKHPFVSKRRTILEPALSAFKANDPVSCIKILTTEIEGIIRDAHISELGTSAKIDDLLQFAIERGIKKSGSDASLFFPKEFLLYMKNCTFAHFDPLNLANSTLSRHSTSHGAASGEAYTQVRALQAILTTDQLAYFL